MVLFPVKNITLYSPYYDTENNLKYKRTNIDGVNISSKRNASMSDKGVNIFYTTNIVIDNKYTVKTGDKIVLTSLDLDIEKIKDLQEYEVLTVVGVRHSNIFSNIVVEAK